MVELSDRKQNVITRTLAGPLLIAVGAAIMCAGAQQGWAISPVPGIVYALLLVISCLFNNTWGTAVSLVFAVGGILLQTYLQNRNTGIDWNSVILPRFLMHAISLVGIALVVTAIQGRLRRATSEPQREERELFQAIMASMHDAIVETDWKGIRDVNASFSRMTGFSREELIGAKAPFPFWPIEQYASIAVALENSMRGQKLDFELVLTRKSGERFPVLLSVSRILEGEKTSSRVLYSFRDITELKQAEAAAREYQEFLSAQGSVLEKIAVGAPVDAALLATVRMIEGLIRGSICMVMIVKEDGKSLRLAAAPSLPAELRAAADNTPVGPDNGSCGRAAFTGRREQTLDFAKDAQGSEYAALALRLGMRGCHSEPVLARDGKVLGTLGIHFREVRPMTKGEVSVLESASRLAAVAIERGREEGVLRRGEMLLRRLVDSNIIGIIVSDRERLFDANDVFLSMVGYSRLEMEQGLIRRDLLQLPDFVEKDDKAFSEMSRRGACTPFEKEMFRKDGSRVPVLIGAAVIEDNPLKWISFVVDLTEQKRAARELREAKESAEIANRTKDRFLNLLSHELRSPLTPILTLASLLEDDPRLAPDIRADMEVIRRNAEMEARLIDDLLDLVRIAKGRLSPDIDVTVRGVRASAAVAGELSAAIDRQTDPQATKMEPLDILLVEDHVDTARVLSRLLTRRGHRVTVAESVATGLEKATHGKFDFLISDVGLPDGTGHDLMRKLVTDNHIRGIALSGFGSEDDIRRSREAGFLEHLTKPVNFETLHEAISRLKDSPRP